MHSLLLLLAAAASAPPEDPPEALAASLDATRALAPTRYDAWPWRVEVEGGAFWSARNDVRIPGDSGTRFSFEDLTGGGPWPIGRVTAEWDVSDRHGVRLIYAPVRADGTGTLSQPTNFDGTMFAPGASPGATASTAPSAGNGARGSVH
jgi:hypothetical protein